MEWIKKDFAGRDQRLELTEKEARHLYVAAKRRIVKLSAYIDCLQGKMDAGELSTHGQTELVKHEEEMETLREFVNLFE